MLELSGIECEDAADSSVHSGQLNEILAGRGYRHTMLLAAVSPPEIKYVFAVN